MKIILIGDFSGNFDEGLKNIAKYNYDYLKKKHNVEIINVKRKLSMKSIMGVIKFKPDILHYFTAPTYSAFILLKILHIFFLKSKTLISALHAKPSPLLYNRALRFIVKLFLKPNLILYQNDPDFYKGLGENILYFPNGVNVNKFMQVDKKTKEKLRLKYGIDKNKFTILHVGHLSRKRNLEIFTKIQRLNKDFQTLIVAGTYIYQEYDLYSILKNAKCKIIVGYIKNIEEIYALSDCYVFPVPFGNSINIPLTILEALSCNLPVISYNYPSLSIFNEGNGIYFVKSQNDILSRFSGNLAATL